MASESTSPEPATARSGADTAIFLQKACLQHRYIRSRDTSNIVERPERLRAVHVGLAAGLARLEHARSEARPRSDATAGPDDLANAMRQLEISHASSSKVSLNSASIVNSAAAVNILNNPAVKFVHGDIDGDVYLENLCKWARDSHDRITKGESEIPEGYSQGDLYLCPESIDAVQGALGTVCEAVDQVVSSSRVTNTTVKEPKYTRAFVAIRPPGHHCGEDTPSGFCFVNNVVIGAAHAHMKYSINRVVIFDIDLHHGNGTQSLAWQINEESYRKGLEKAAGAPAIKPGLQIYYGSVHDVLSYPCEDGKPELVQAASVSIHGPHGQHIENIHLKPYESDAQFWDELYAGPYSRLLELAGKFIDTTGGPADDTLVFISCGFDASEHEYPSMSRHQRHVPTSFYYRFARDTRAFADRVANGRLLSVLEGGYSDRALTSGAMAHVVGLAAEDEARVDESWWSLERLVELEKATKKRRGGRPSQSILQQPWLERTLEIFNSIDVSASVSRKFAPRAPIPPSARTLRERKTESPSVSALVKTQKSKSRASESTKPASAVKPESYSGTASISEESDTDSLSTISSASSAVSGAVRPEGDPAQKKLPRVILKLGPRPDPPSNP
ncbi:hypothetical protein CERSUDRAFT_127402 [Gelatoporia subvermispora B]|uniref:Histone deacetylase domain-containing protein n=1 Tax=Ceriporiopsis subvermispora (strain B) TaxID=914234 RepID=M2P7S2_CERS8|nr:hypothetical protein CERSUDRAFT_127402 [Gelatoporia subvermispora B]